jgi:hypothetical protein
MRYLITAIAILLATSSTPAQSVTKYNILFLGKSGGSQTTRTSEGTVTVDYSYRDNGRGPDLKEDFTLAEDGTLVRYVGKGTSTFGAAIDETFTLLDGKAEWKSVADQGSSKPPGAAAHVPIECSNEMMAQVVRAVARKPGGRLPALPSGELSVEKLLDERVEAGGKARDVSLYALKGLTEEPYYVWLTKEPELKLFASITPGWMQVVEAGFEPVAARLETRQVEADAAELNKLAVKLSHKLPEPILIRNTRVFDSEHATLGPAKDVYINRGRIAAVYDANSPTQGAGTVIDAGGRVLLPGLFDMHGHMTTWATVQHVAGGVTSVRDMGNDNTFVKGLIDSIEKGTVIGPRIVPAGFIEGSSNFSAKSGFVLANLDEVKKAIDWYAQHGYPQIKIYNSFYREWLPEAATYAHSRGLRVSGHVPAFMRAEEVVKAGFDEIQHINQVLLNFLVKPEDDTRTLLRFNLVAQHAHRLDFKSPRVREFLALLKERQTVIDPTLSTFEGMFVQKQGDMNPSYAAIADHLPAATQRSNRTNSMKIPLESLEDYRASYAKMVEFVGVMHKEGIPIVAGTDAMPGFTLHRELELYVKAGIPPAEALRVATWNGAKYTRTLDRTGSITPGKLADVILVEGDPTKDVSAVRNISLVMKEGVAYYPSEMYEAMGIKPFVKPVKPEVVGKK